LSTGGQNGGPEALDSGSLDVYREIHQRIHQVRMPDNSHAHSTYEMEHVPLDVAIDEMRDGLAEIGIHERDLDEVIFRYKRIIREHIDNKQPPYA
jgi:hypothetical protein